MAECSDCGAPFTCGLRESGSPCWCASLPPLAGVAPGTDCLCPACLAARLAAEHAAQSRSPSNHETR